MVTGVEGWADRIRQAAGFIRARGGDPGVYYHPDDAEMFDSNVRPQLEGLGVEAVAHRQVEPGQVYVLDRLADGAADEGGADDESS